MDAKTYCFQFDVHCHIPDPPKRLYWFTSELVVLHAGITDKEEGGPFLLEAKQGDTISGNVSRPELARIVATALSTPQAAGGLPSVTLFCIQ